MINLKIVIFFQNKNLKYMRNEFIVFLTGEFLRWGFLRRCLLVRDRAERDLGRGWRYQGWHIYNKKNVGSRLHWHYGPRQDR